MLHRTPIRGEWLEAAGVSQTSNRSGVRDVIGGHALGDVLDRIGIELESGRPIAAKYAAGMTKVPLEAGGKNPLVVLDDIHLGMALQDRPFAAGQRCIEVGRGAAGVDDHVPFGGRKGSSQGPRKQGACVVERCTTVRTAGMLAV